MFNMFSIWFLPNVRCTQRETHQTFSFFIQTTTFLKKLFFPSTITEWIKLDPGLIKAESLSVFERVFTWDPKKKSTETKYRSTIKEILFTLLFIAVEMKWISFRGWPEINGPLSKRQSFLFTHVQMFPFIWFYFG